MRQFPLILSLTLDGYPHAWMTFNQAVTAKVKGNIAYEIGNPDVLARGGISRMTGLQSEVAVSSIIALKGKYKKKDRVVLNNHNLFRRDLSCCAFCGRAFRDEKLSRDHVIPRSRGGKDVWTNVVTSCKSCNNLKGDSLLSEIGWELLYVPYEPSHTEELILKNRNIIADQMYYLKAYLPAHSRLQNIQ